MLLTRHSCLLEGNRSWEIGLQAGATRSHVHGGQFQDTSTRPDTLAKPECTSNYSKRLAEKGVLRIVFHGSLTITSECFLPYSPPWTKHTKHIGESHDNANSTLQQDPSSNSNVNTAPFSERHSVAKGFEHEWIIVRGHQLLSNPEPNQRFVKIGPFNSKASSKAKQSHSDTQSGSLDPPHTPSCSFPYAAP